MNTQALSLRPTPAGPAGPPGAALLDDPVEQAAFTRRVPAAGNGGPHIAESALRLGGLHCAACAGTIEQALHTVPGVLEARVDAASHTASVRWDARLTRPSVLVRAIEHAGYSAAPDTAAAARELRRREARTALWRVVVAAFCAMQVMMLAAPAYFSAPGDLPPDQKRLLDWAGWLLTLPVLWFAAAPFFAGAWRALRDRRIAMDVPVALGIAVAFVASTGAAFDPGGPFGAEVYFDSLTMFVAFLLGGRWLEMQARHRAEARLEDATLRLPDTVLRVLAGGGVESVSARQLQVGDRLRIPVGQAFAADGVLTDGATEADESLLTGESQPVAKARGDAVIAGSVNRLAPVEMRVERLGADTRFEAILALMRAARTERPAALAHADRWAGPFLWAVLALAGAAGAVWSVLDPSRAVWVVVSVLIVTCPCALSLAAPSALVAAAGAMGRRGVLLRRLGAIQGLAQMRTLFVDKTGTLTDGSLRCTEVEALAHTPGVSTESLRAVAAALAAWSSHPLAVALRAVGATGATGRGEAVAWHDVGEVAGQGLRATAADGGHWRLGSAAWVRAGRSDAPAADHSAAEAGAADHSAAEAGNADSRTSGPCRADPLASDPRASRSDIVDADSADGRVSAAQTFLGLHGQALLRFGFDERVRPDALAAVQALQADGVRVVLLSGDAPARAAHIGRQLGVAEALGAMTPDAKLAAVRAAQQRGDAVGMLGDGINDAPVLAQADVSIAMGEGALVARGEADGVLVSNRLGDVARARALAKKTLRVMRQNLAWAALYNAACVPLALAGWLPPWAAGLGMATSSLVVVLNSLRLAR